ncbi:PREDICTED: uncharacterized protein LOC104800578 [Tarenaya hassleriana]|uniref:uncharacterized protein LOC104800578 n=1 Tax=Tarenaya hassleriana TaxID=28532 RepID=UPI00053C7E2F|nr:PREDICTED: uncharacterized protein LOC104800578 [Tarenaya hassleriana]
MENEQSTLLSWVYQCQGKTTEELRHSLLYTSLELEQTRMAAHEELRMRDDQIMELKRLLNKAITERDEALQRLTLEKKLLLLPQQQQGVSSVHEEEQDRTRRGNDLNVNGFSSSDGEESIVSSFDPPKQIQPPLLPPPSPEMAKIELAFAAEKPLPEKGKLLQAVMKAGPLLQTLLLVGPLPQWQHPPPQLESIEIPPVIIPPSPQSELLQHHDSLIINSCGNLNRKRVLCNDSNYQRETKYQRLVFP